MSRSFVTDMQHFMDEKGVISESVSKKVRCFTQNMEKVIACVACQSTDLPKPVVSCWGRMNGKRCSGKIDACLELGSLNIIWHCLKCGDHGSISNWKPILGQ